MVGWHHRFNGDAFRQAPGDGEGQDPVVHGVTKNRTWLTNWTTTKLAIICWLLLVCICLLSQEGSSLDDFPGVSAFCWILRLSLLLALNLYLLNSCQSMDRRTVHHMHSLWAHVGNCLQHIVLNLFSGLFLSDKGEIETFCGQRNCTVPTQMILITTHFYQEQCQQTDWLKCPGQK